MSTFLQIVSLEARTMLSYRAEFWFKATLGFLADFGVVYFIWVAMFRESGRELIGGRTVDATILYYVLVVLLGRLVRGERMHGQISSDIYEGSLNRYLVFPYSYFRFKYAQRLGQMAPDILKGVVFGIIAAFFVDLTAWDASVSGVLMSACAVLAGNFIYFLLLGVVHQVAFWADNVWSLDVAVWFITSLLGGWLLPLSVFPRRRRRRDAVPAVPLPVRLSGARVPGRDRPRGVGVGHGRRRGVVSPADGREQVDLEAR